MTMTTKTKRIRLLSETEINDLYALPQFTAEERQWYFELTGKEQDLLTLSISQATKVDAILGFRNNPPKMH